MSDQRVEDNTTRATARLPGLDIEIIHRRSPAAEVEQISINLQAVPYSRHSVGSLRRRTHLCSGLKLSKWRGSHGLTSRVRCRCPVASPRRLRS